MFETYVWLGNIQNISYCEFVEDFAPEDWKKWHKFNQDAFEKERIIFFKYTGKQSKYKKAVNFYDDVEVSKDYDDAEHIRDSQFTRINKVMSWLKNIRWPLKSMKKE